MNKFFKNFSKYLLIASLGFASVQAANTDRETRETKKLDRIISKNNMIIAGEVFVVILQSIMIFMLLSFCVRENIGSCKKGSWLSGVFNRFGGSNTEVDSTNYRVDGYVGGSK